MPSLHELSPYVQTVLDNNHFTALEVLRYGPRYACLVVRCGEQEGFFKIVLPLEERRRLAPADYVWTDYDDMEKLEQRLLKEAVFLQFFSHQIGEAGFEPQIIAMSDQSPVWSVRTFVRERTMSAWGSDFVFSPRFFKTISPREAVNFFVRLHEMSDTLPVTLAELISGFTSTLTNIRRFSGTAGYAKHIPQFAERAEELENQLMKHLPAYRQFRPVLTHYEPYPPHIFYSDGRMGLIDWENIGWGHSLQDFSVLYMRCFMDQDWQSEYLKLIREHGYFEGNGQLFWDSEMLIQGFANYNYFAEGGPIGTPEYDKAAVKFFSRTIEDVLARSPYFKA